MSHVRVYIDSPLRNDSLAITDTEIIHKIRSVLRLEAEKSLYLFDGKGTEFLCKIIEVKRNSIVVQKIKIAHQEHAKTTSIILGFPLTKGDKVDFILQKATELGASEFTPFVCERSIQTVSSEVKMKRWQKILIEATRQSGGLWIPKLNDTCAFADLIQRPYAMKLAATITGEGARTIFTAPCKEAFIMVGPEGDFSDHEYAQLRKNNFKAMNLSPNILKVETATIFAINLVHYFLTTHNHT